MNRMWLRFQVRDYDPQEETVQLRFGNNGAGQGFLAHRATASVGARPAEARVETPPWYEYLLQHPFFAPRIAPFVGLCMGVGVLLLNHDYFLEFEAIFLMAVFIGPPMAVLSLAALIRPELLWSLENNDYSFVDRCLAWGFFIIGLILAWQLTRFYV
jgi:hypothetical protein